METSLSGRSLHTELQCFCATQFCTRTATAATHLTAGALSGRPWRRTPPLDRVQRQGWRSEKELGLARRPTADHLNTVMHQAVDAVALSYLRAR